MLMPQQIMTTVTQNGEVTEQAIGALRLDYLGGQGLFIGMLVALLVTRFYAFLSAKKLMIKIARKCTTDGYTITFTRFCGNDHLYVGLFVYVLIWLYSIRQYFSIFH